MMLFSFLLCSKVTQLYTYVCVCEYIYTYIYIQMWASLVAQTIKRLPAIWETWVRSLGQEDPLEKEMATHSSTLA